MLSWPAPLLPTLPGTGPVLKVHDTARGEVVARQALGLAVEDACDQLLKARNRTPEPPATEALPRAWRRHS